MGGACTSNKKKVVKPNEKSGENKDKEADNKEKEKKDSKIKEIKEDSNENQFTSREITFKITDQDKEYTEKVKSSEKISYLFNLITKYKTKKHSEYDLMFEEDISLASKLTEEIGVFFKTEDTVSLKMLYLGLNISLEVKKDYEASNTLIAQPLYDLGGNIGLLIYNKFENTFSSEIHHIVIVKMFYIFAVEKVKKI